MARLSYAVPFALVLTFAASCGSKSASTPDAVVVKVTDAPPPIDGMPDALVCIAPEMMCTAGACTNTNTDEQNCGACGTVCQGGAACKAPPDGCTCPAGFLPDNIPASGLTDIFITQLNAVHLSIGIGGFGSTNGLDGLMSLVVTPNTTATMIDTDYTLSAPSSGGIPTQPVIAALYGIDISNMTADSQFVAVSGTVRYSILQCEAGGSEMKGTLTDVKFQGATGGIASGGFTVDPNGCTFTVTKVTFDIKNTTACTP
jgi:hypothetical protein